MTLRDELKPYNLSLEHFARLIDCATESLVKYEKDDPSLRDKTREKIERGLAVIEEHNLVAPKRAGISLDPYWNTVRSEKYHKEVAAYDRRFMELLDRFI